MYEKIYHIITDISGKYIYVNPHFKERFGFMHEDFNGNESIKSIYEEDAQIAIAATQRLLEGKSIVEHLELRKPNSDGTYFWTFWEFKLNFNNENNPNGIVCIGYDITKIRTTEIDNLNVRKLINHSNLIANLSSFCYEIDSNTIQLSDEFYEIYNFNKRDIITIEDLLGKVHPEDLPNVDLRILEHLKKSNSVLTRQYRILDNQFENGIKYIESVFEYYYNSFSEKEYVLGLIFDITKHKKKETEFSFVISHLRSILDSHEQSVAVINREFRLVTYNIECLKIADKYGIEPFVGQYILDYIPDSYKDKIIKLYERAFKGETIKLDFNMYYPDGHFLSDICYYPIQNDANEIEFVVINCKFNDAGLNPPNEKIKIAKSIIDFQEIEKNRIATDLHDSVNQLLYIAKLNLSEIPDSNNKFKVKEMLDKANAEIKSIINNSSQFILENTSFLESIEHYLFIIFKDSITKYNVELIENFQTELKYDTKLNIFRIIQEIAQNVSKHSSAQNFKIKIKISKNKMIILTGDNGKGFEYSQLSSGKGLENIKNRVYLMNGEVRIRTKFNIGTLFIISIPIYD